MNLNSPLYSCKQSDPILKAVSSLLIIMEQVNLGYSTMNIAVPSKDTYLQMMVNSVEKLIHNLRWRAFHFLKEEPSTNSKENFQFKSTAPAPQLQEMKEFEDGMVNLVKGIKFENKPNDFRKKQMLEK